MNYTKFVKKIFFPSLYKKTLLLRKLNLSLKLLGFQPAARPVAIQHASQNGGRQPRLRLWGGPSVCVQTAALPPLTWVTLLSSLDPF